MTDKFFWQGIQTDEDLLIKAMDVAGDHLVPENGSRKAQQRAQRELSLIKALETSDADVREKCIAMWELIKTGEGSIGEPLPSHPPG